MAIVEDYFPRGSKSKAVKKEVAHYEKKRKNDTLFKDSGSKSKKKKLKKNPAKAGKNFDDDPISKKSKKKEEKEKTALDSIEPFTYNMLSEGMHLLSKIQEVREMDVLLSLPGRLQAVVPITNISTPYSKLLTQLANNEDITVKSLKEILKDGQLFPCTIKEVTNDGSHKITASLNPSDLCSDIPLKALSKGMKLVAAVQSIEDHGFFMDIGIANVRCFLPKEANLELDVGQILNVCVAECETDGLVATLKLSTTTSVKFKQNVELNVSTLIPGTKLHVNVTKVTPYGLTVTFGNLIGYIHKDHLSQTFDDMKSYTKGSNQTAVVLYTIPLVNAVYLTLKPALVNPEKASTSEPLALGRIMDNATILTASSVGIFLQLTKKIKGFVPLRHVSDKEIVIEDIKNHFPIKSQKRCRILQHAALDDVYICTLKKTLIDQKALRYEDFTVGEIVEGKIDAVLSSGITVKLGENLNGFIPKLHWAEDPRLKKPELRFRSGEPITCRVLKVLLDRKSVHLTCKKSLVADEGPIYDQSNQLSPNTALKGTVSLVDKGGVLVTFYGDLTGWIPKVWLNKKGITDIGRYFYVGQLIDCSVSSVNEEGKVMLKYGSADLVDVPAPSSDSQSLGSIVQARVDKIFSSDQDNSHGLQVFVPSLKMNAFIPAHHLSDFPALGSSLLPSFRVGEMIEEAVVWASTKLQTILSLKPSIVKCAKENRFPRSVADIELNAILPCVLARHRTFGIFAKLLCPPTHWDVLFPKTKMRQDVFTALEKSSDISLEGRIIDVNHEEKKVSISALDTDLPISDAEVLGAYFRETERIKTTYLESQDEGLKYLAGLKPGASVIGKVSSEFNSSADVEFELPHGMKGIVPTYHHAQKNFKKNDLIVGCVLYCDLVHRLVYVSTRDDVITHFSGIGTKVAPQESKLEGQVLLNLDYFSLVSISQKKVKDIAYVSNLRNMNDICAPLPPPFRVGQDVSVVINAVVGGKVATYHNPPTTWSASKSSKKRTMSTSDGPDKKKTKKEANLKKTKQTASADGAKKEDSQSKAEDGPTTLTKKQKKKNKKGVAETTAKGQVESSKEVDDTATTKKKVKSNKSDEKAKVNSQPSKPILNDEDDDDDNLQDNAEDGPTTLSKKQKKKNKKGVAETTAKGQVESGEKVVDAATTKKKVKSDKSDDKPKVNNQASRPILNDVDDDAPSPKKSKTSDRATKALLGLPRLQVSSAFKWEDETVGAMPAIPDSSDSEGEEEEAVREKLVVKDRRERARQKLEETRIEEAKLSQIEESLNDPGRTPVTPDDFDRMVLASPNSSILWLQYMAFHLENAEIEKARTVAQRALKVISFREEQEKFNVWIAWLNLEHMYGTTEGYEETFQEALRYNEPFKVYRQMALNFEQSGKAEEAESLHTTMLKKFKQDKSVWLNACHFYVRNSKFDTARNIFQRALSVLDKKEHIDLISRFAQLEVKFGQLERGKTLFDTLMMSYPKRTDLWLVYVDTLTKAGDVESARQVLERCITLQLPAKKMKTIFQKFLEFETHHGDSERQDYVREKALEYVESKSVGDANPEATTAT